MSASLLPLPLPLPLAAAEAALATLLPPLARFTLTPSLPWRGAEARWGPPARERPTSSLRQEMNLEQSYLYASADLKWVLRAGVKQFFS